MRSKYSHMLILLFLFAVAAVHIPMARCADKNEVIRKTNGAYYSLSRNGLMEFRCEVLPDWDAAYKDLKMDAVGRDQVIPAAKQTHFEVAVGPTGAILVSHQSDVAPATEEMAKRIRDVTGGIDQILTGFFQTWSQFMFNAPLPGSDSEYQMEEIGGGYRLTTEGKDVHAVITMDREFVINTMEAKTPELEGTVHPHFVSHAGGLVLAKYEGNYGTGSNSQVMSVEIQYQDIGNLPLPRVVTLTMLLPQGKFDQPIAFSDCRIKKRQNKSE